MKKTLSINLNNLVFVIDEDAYTMLEMYLDQLTRYFSKHEDQQEIVSDIEARIAELLQTRKDRLNDIIQLHDIEQVISIIGNPEEFGEEANEDAPNDFYQKKSNYRRMYRDVDHRILGGVCSGLGAYWGIDPVIIRIIFLIAFFGFGVGLLIYLVLWIVIPEALTASQKLEMRGEPVNISSIGDFVRDEWNHVKNSMNFGGNKNRRRS